MTTYISSLIEPVVRHARRFSRTSIDDAERPEALTAEGGGGGGGDDDDDVGPGPRSGSGSGSGYGSVAPADQQQKKKRDLMTAVPEEEARADDNNRVPMSMPMPMPVPSQSGPHQTPAGQAASEHESETESANEAEMEDEDADVLTPMSIATPTPNEANPHRRGEQRYLRTPGPLAGEFSAAAAAAAAADSDSGSLTRSRGTTDPLPRESERPIVNRRNISWEPTTGNRHGALPIRSLSSLPNVGGLEFADDPANGQSIRMSTGNGSGRRSSAMSLDANAQTHPADQRPTGTMLPEDDGMRLTRDRIQAIQALDIPVAEKSRMMHDIMTEKWSAGQPLTPREAFKDENLGRPQSPATPTLRSQEVLVTPRSGGTSILDSVSAFASELNASPSTSASSETFAEDYNLQPEDLIPTYWKSSTGTTSTPAAGESESLGDEDLYGDLEDEELPPLGCAHYKRNVKLQCVDCHRWYTCRFCHDAVESHTLVRHRTRNMLCMLCATPQPAAKTCQNCNEDAAAYFCSVCKLWDDDPAKKIYHCSACGICRLGEGLGKDFFHCSTCDACISMNIRDKHRCIERSIDCDCPICGEYMFTSPKTVVFMRCGHSIHQACYRRFLERNYRCPICGKSVMNMEMSFRRLDRTIESQPMPEEYRDTRAIVQCNDCRCKTNVPYHWLGLKCAECDSYNTSQLSIIGPHGAPPSVMQQSNPEDEARRGSWPNAGEEAPAVSEESIDTRSRRSSNNLLLDGRLRRPTSAGGLQDPEVFLRADEFRAVAAGSRSASAAGMERVRADWEVGGHRRASGTAANGFVLASGDGDENYGSDDDEDDDMNPWGPSFSPRLLPRGSPSLGPASEGGSGVAETARDHKSDADQNEDVSSSSEDDILDDDPEGDDDDDDDDMIDDIEIFGHR